jgi:argininosuccinate lyase
VSGTGGPWHRAYVERVLRPDQGYAAAHLLDAFLDVLVAHVRTVARLPAAEGHEETLLALDVALQNERARAAPLFEAGVPDLYFAIQRRLEDALGEEALGWLRLGLSRNDLDMTVYKVAARARLLALAHRLGALQDALLSQAEAHVETVVIARTHHQPAQPSTLAHLLAAVAAGVARDQRRLLGVLERLDACPLGACALSGSSHPLDRASSAAALGFAGPVENAYDAVAASDWQLDVAALTQTLAVHRSRTVQVLMPWAEAGALRLPDGLAQGSSIMPQKRNPVALEHARARLSRAAGASQQLVFLSHNVPLADLNDGGTDAQEPLHAALEALDAGLDLLTAVVRESAWDTGLLAAEAAASDTTATELADELVRAGGLPFPLAHRRASELVRRLAAEGRPLQRATPADLAAVGGPALDPETLAAALSPRAFVERRSGVGGPAPAVVEAHLARLRREQAEYHDDVATATSRVEGALRRLRTPGKDVQT